MLLKGSQRGYGANLAAHITNTRENDHVTVADIRGMAATDVMGACLEIEATAQGTKAKQPFFHVSFNPPENAELTRDQFTQSIAKLEAKMGLEEQPRIIVFHEKNGREHAHVVYSRIYESLAFESGRKAGLERPEPILKAKELSFSKLELRRISQDLHRDLGLEMPKGLADYRERDPLNFDLPTWQQATRLKEDPRDLKKIIGEAMQFADGAKGFNAALEQHAMQLARGDRRGFVIVHHSGEALPLTRYLGLKQKEVKARLGQPEHVQTVDQARGLLKSKMTAHASKQMEDLHKQQRKEAKPMRQAVKLLKKEQQLDRQKLFYAQDARKAEEEKSRADRIRKGIGGLWDRAQLWLGKGKLANQFATEIESERLRDAKELHTLKSGQQKERQQLQKSIVLMREKHRREKNQARSKIGYWLTLDSPTNRATLEKHMDALDKAKADMKERVRGNKEAEKIPEKKSQRRSKDKGMDFDL